MTWIERMTRVDHRNGFTGALLTTGISSVSAAAVSSVLSRWLRPSLDRRPYGDSFEAPLLVMGLVMISLPMALWLLRGLPIGRANGIVVLAPVLATAAITPSSDQAGLLVIPMATVFALIACRHGDGFAAGRKSDWSSAMDHSELPR